MEIWYNRFMKKKKLIVGNWKMNPRSPALARAGVGIYSRLVENLHLRPESREQMIARLGEDRIASGAVVS